MITPVGGFLLSKQLAKLMCLEPQLKCLGPPTLTELRPRPAYWSVDQLVHRYETRRFCEDRRSLFRANDDHPVDLPI
jgi:hypothetical protein